jgi:hypothetical protein
LKPGKPIAVHTYDVQAGAGQYLHFVIAPRQANLKAALTARMANRSW